MDRRRHTFRNDIIHMRSSTQMQQLRDAVTALPKPALTVWAQSGEALGGSVGEALRLRVRNAIERCMKDRPESVGARRADATLRTMLDAIGRRGGHRTVLVASSLADGHEPRVEVHGFAAQIPVGDTELAAEARIGEPWLTPLDLASSQTLRVGALHPHDAGVEVFEFFMNEAARIAEFDISPVPGAFDRLPRSKPVHPAPTPDRGGSSYDDAAEHRKAWRAREYGALVEPIEQLLDEREVDLIVTFGSTKHRPLLDRHLAPRLGARFDGEAGNSLPVSPADERRLLDGLARFVNDAVARRAASQLTEISERGVLGLPACLEALQRGQLETLVVPWDLDEQVFVEEATGQVAQTARQAATGEIDGRRVHAVAARGKLVELAQAHATQVSFTRVGYSNSPFDEVKGVAGLPRWT